MLLRAQERWRSKIGLCCCGVRFGAPIEVLRRFLSILLLAVFGLPLITALLAFGADGDVSLPACCRRNGKHHCLLSADQRNPAPDKRVLTTVSEKCPYAPGMVVATHPDVLSVPPSQAIFAAFVSHSCGVAQTESKWRISRDRSRQKRGPPTLLS